MAEQMKLDEDSGRLSSNRERIIERERERDNTIVLDGEKEAYDFNQKRYSNKDMNSLYNKFPSANKQENNLNNRNSVNMNNVEEEDDDLNRMLEELNK